MVSRTLAKISGVDERSGGPVIAPTGNEVTPAADVPVGGAGRRSFFKSSAAGCLVLALLAVSGCSHSAPGSAAQDVRQSAPVAQQAADRHQACQVVSTALGRLDVCGGTAAQIARVAPAARTVSEVWGPNPDMVSVTFSSSDADFDAAAANIDSDTMGVTTRAGVFIAPSSERSLTTTGRQALLAHELVHARLKQYGSANDVLWVREGAAEWTATRALGLKSSTLWPSLSADLQAGWIPSGPATNSEFERNAVRAYELSNAYVAFLVERLGQQQVVALVRENHTTAEVDDFLRRRALIGRPFADWLQRQLRN